MAFIFTKKKERQHEENSRDVYFRCLEEAYGNLPVPSDDYADIASLLGESFDQDKLQEATEIIAEHYDAVAKALGKEKKYG